jgi:hypothetical protein
MPIYEKEKNEVKRKYSEKERSHDKIPTTFFSKRKERENKRGKTVYASDLQVPVIGQVCLYIVHCSMARPLGLMAPS